ncbi:MAG TPA: YceI family protein [Flavobacteriaceae bacterium]|nr:YceI family protein [Flavobacteriaceae bacterium]
MDTKNTWALDPTHSELTFKVRHMMISNVKGEFKDFTIDVKGDDLLNSDFQANIATTSVNTNNTDRDNHLRSADFFDSENHPALTFKSTGITQKEGNEYKLKGLLSIKGVSKEITLDIEYGGINKDPWGNEKSGISFEGKINRKDWGLNWNTALETGGVLVSDEVKLYGELQFVKQS